MSYVNMNFVKSNRFLMKKKIILFLHYSYIVSQLFKVRPGPQVRASIKDDVGCSLRYQMAWNKCQFEKGYKN